MSDKGLVVLAAGGTGGHLFPAQALAETLTSRGYRIHLMTDERVRDYGKNFPAEAVHVVPSASPSLKNPRSLATLYGGYRKAKAILRQTRPVAVAGFGGYPSFPPLYAAAHLQIPTLVHEQNAVFGRANRLLASRVDAVATSFADVTGVTPRNVAKIVFTGNPVRAIALKRAGAPYPEFNGSFNLVVFGGSQGARFFSDFMPQVLSHFPMALRRTLKLVQQCRVEDLDHVKATYEKLDLTFELNAFFPDMPSHIAGSHLVIGRAGASTIAELGVIGRPAILVPLPHAIDNDQLRNAQSFAGGGAGWVNEQKDLEPGSFAAFIQQLMQDRAGLKRAALMALSRGKPKAAEALADLVEKIAKPLKD